MLQLLALMRREVIFKVLILLFIFSILGNFILAFSCYKKRDIVFENNKNINNSVNLPMADQYLTEEKDEAFSGNYVKKVDYSSNKELNLLLSEGDKENINFWFKQGPNFADHYIVMTMGCGTMCKYLIIVDAVNGKMYKPDANAQLGFRFDIMSKLLIANDPWIIYENFGDKPLPDWLSTRYYIWENNSLKLIGENKIELQVKINK
jgi:hypothetical protein